MIPPWPNSFQAQTKSIVFLPPLADISSFGRQTWIIGQRSLGLPIAIGPRQGDADEMADEKRSIYQIFLRPASESSVHSIADFPSG